MSPLPTGGDIVLFIDHLKVSEDFETSDFDLDL